MLEKLRARFHRPSPATAIALVALFVALGGTGYAALKLPKNSVGTKQIKNNAVTGAKVKNGTLTASDFGGTLPTGATGPKGDAGAAGAAGAAGTNGTNGAKGDKGDDGDDGAPGAPGGALKTKITGGPQLSAAANNFATLTLPSFTPAANKAELVVIKVDWTTPPGSCTPTPAPPAGAQIFVKLDGNPLANQVGPASGGSGASQTLTTSAPIVSSATPTSHTVAVDIADNCTGVEDATINTATVERVEFSAAP